MTHELADQPDENFLKKLFSKRKQLKWRSFSFSYLDITPDEREKLYLAAKLHGLLTTYEFSGVKSFGTSRNDAASRLLEDTRKRACAKLKIEFGARAHFWVRPRQFADLGLDFYWRLARFAVIVTGPLTDDLARVDTTRERDLRADFAEAFKSSSSKVSFRNIEILQVPYYFIWHHPSDFLSKVRTNLVASGRYPKLGQPI